MCKAPFYFLTWIFILYIDKGVTQGKEKAKYNCLTQLFTNPTVIAAAAYCQAQAPNPKTQKKGPWAYTKISWATHHPTTHNF